MSTSGTLFDVVSKSEKYNPITRSCDRWAWIPQTIALFILVGSAGPHFDSTLKSVGNSATIAANRLSFFGLQLSVSLSWSGTAADYFVYHPENTSRWKVFVLTNIGQTVSFIFINLIGVGLASVVASTPGWDQAYKISSGALILAGYDGLQGFGKFCAVIVALGLCANQVPTTYSAGLNFQVLGRLWKVVPRYCWSTVTAIIYFVCAVVGRDHLITIFQNFLALVGYWLVIFLTIFMRGTYTLPTSSCFDWAAYEDPSKLPIGIAALLSFLIGWVGPIVGMYQAWWTGPIAAKAGDNGGDMGIWLALAFTAIVFPPMRWLELKRFGR